MKRSRSLKNKNKSIKGTNRVSDRRNARQALKISQKKLHETQLRLSTLLENLPNVVFYETGAGRLLISDNITEMLGHSPEVFRKDKNFFANLIHPADKQKLGLELDEWHKKTEPRVFTKQFRVLDKGGNYRWIEDHIVRMVTSDGEKYMSGIIIDITERKKSEEELQLLANALESTTEMVSITDLNNGFKFVNKAFLDKYGYSQSDIIGLQPSVLYSQKNPKNIGVDIYSHTLRGGWSGELINRKKDGSEFPVFLSTSTITDADGNLLGLIGVARDITERKETEELINKRNNEIKLLYEKTRQSLHEKEILLKEIHHRVKNNLQVVSSLLKLQSEYIKDENARSMFTESQNRVKSMALIHQKLYQSKDLGNVSFGDYIEALTTHLMQAYSIRSGDIKVVVDAENIVLGVDTAIPCGLIVNELFTNCIKHAFPDRRKGIINIILRRCDRKFELTVRDNGVGIPEGMDIKDIPSLGIEIVTTLTEQLDGSMEVKRNGGTNFMIKFPAQSYKPRI